MPRNPPVKKTVKARIQELEQQLQEAEETLRAIREGLVDALIVAGPHGDQVYTLKGADHAYRALIETMSEGAVTLSAAGTILYCNRRFAEMLALPLERVLGVSVRQFIPETEQPLLAALLEQGLVNEAKGECVLLSADSRQIPVYLSFASLRLEDAPSVTVIVTDLTERKRAEEIAASERMARVVNDELRAEIVERQRIEAELRRSEHQVSELLASEQAARATAEQAVQVRDRFISIASHELKTPLTSVMGYAELLVRRGSQARVDPQFVHMADTIYRQTERLNKLIGTMLDLSRLEQGQLTLQREQVDLNALIASIVGEVGPALRHHQIRFVANTAKVLVEGDALRLSQVLENLIQNAIKYSPNGGRVRVELRQDDTRACVAVTDDGIGIPEGARASLFTQFYRAANAEAQHISGLGVGLYVSREIARLHGGDIEVESEEDQGSTFTVWLPRA